MKVSVAIGALVLGICVGPSAQAEVLRKFQVANWRAGAYTFDGTRTFSHCAGGSTYNSGITVIFSINRSYAWGLSFWNPQWRLTKGQQYDIAFSIDGSPPIFAKANAIHSGQAVVNLADSSELFLRFRRGNMLQVSSANQVFSFSLDGTSALLPALLDCVRQETNPVVTATNPFSAQQTTTRAQPSRESFQAEAALTAANVLGAAGIDKFSFGSLEDAAKLKADAVWTAGALVGTIKIAENVKLDDPQISSILIGEDAKSCSKGAFLSGSLPDSDGKEMLRIFTSCQQEKKNMTVYYLAVPRPKGGNLSFHHYVGWSAGSSKGSRIQGCATRFSKQFDRRGQKFSARRYQRHLLVPAERAQIRRPPPRRFGRRPSGVQGRQVILGRVRPPRQESAQAAPTARAPTPPQSPPPASAARRPGAPLAPR